MQVRTFWAPLVGGVLLFWFISGNFFQTCGMSPLGVPHSSVSLQALCIGNVVVAHEEASDLGMVSCWSPDTDLAVPDGSPSKTELSFIPGGYCHLYLRLLSFIPEVSVIYT